MRNALITRDKAAQEAGSEVLTATGSAVDATIAAVLAGAVRASPASLLGSAVWLVAGPGVGLHMVDGRARAPGRGEKRPKTPDVVPPSWTAAVPGLLSGALAAHTRFGVESLSAIVRSVSSAVREHDDRKDVRARLKLVQQVSREGHGALVRDEVLRALRAAVAPLGGGIFTDEDLAPEAAVITELAPRGEGPHDVILPAQDVPWWRASQQPAAAPAVPVESVVAMDARGVVACACYVVAPTAVPVADVEGLAFPALLPLPAKGVARWKPGVPVPMSVPLAVLRHEGRAWAAMGISGEGDLEAERDAVVSGRLATVGVELPLGTEAPFGVRNGVVLWAVREGQGDDVRATMVAG